MFETGTRIEVKVILDTKGYKVAFIRNGKTELNWEVAFNHEYDLISLEQEFATKLDHMLELFGLFK